jgi:hypothetical protein
MNNLPLIFCWIWRSARPSGVQPGVRSVQMPAAFVQPGAFSQTAFSGLSARGPLHPVLRKEFNSHDFQLLPGKVSVTEFLLCDL